MLGDPWSVLFGQRAELVEHGNHRPLPGLLIDVPQERVGARVDSTCRLGRGEREPPDRDVDSLGETQPRVGREGDHPVGRVRSSPHGTRQPAQHHVEFGEVAVFGFTGNDE